MKIVLISKNDKRTPADLFVAGFFEKEKLSSHLSQMEPAFAKVAGPVLGSPRFEGKFSQVFSSYHPDHKESKEILLFGLGQRKNHKKLCCRKAFGQILQLAKARKARRIRIFIDTFTNDEVKTADAAGILTEIFQLATYQFDRYKSKNKEAREIQLEIVEAFLSAKPGQEVSRRMDFSNAVTEGILTTRNLINEPANIMNPQTLAKAAQEMASQKKIRCQIIGEAELKRLKMGGILAVNRGSRIPAALIVLEYGERYKKNGTVCLVGKGVTFDTGGISIKPARDMEKMKYDMSGAAAVIGTLGVAADLKLPLHVVGLAPAVENNVAEDPQRPGDIIRMYNGKSVEVLNTDAEGRLILGDALAYSEKFKPDAIVDLATLTGMCAATFGDKAIGLMTNDERFGEKVRKAGDAVGERCWELPMWDEYRDQIKGHHSDLYNIGGPYGGTITAAKFLQEFVPDKTPWVHLDIAGTAWADSNRYDCPKGATGVGVKLLIELLSHWR